MKNYLKIFLIILIFMSVILSTVNVNATEFRASEIYNLATTDTETNPMYNLRCIGNIITIIQVLSGFISPIIFIISGIGFIIARKKGDEKKIKKAKKVFLVCTIIAIILLTVFFIIESSKSFSSL